LGLYFLLGVEVTDELLGQVLAAAPSRNGRRVLRFADLRGARLRGSAGFDGVSFEGGAWFDWATFQGDAGVTSLEGTAEGLRATLLPGRTVR
jgi:uncharacterized protein YjbI with pentapeptide repeats